MTDCFLYDLLLFCTFMIRMGHIQTSHIHSSLMKFFNARETFCRGAYGTNNLVLLISYCNVGIVRKRIRQKKQAPEPVSCFFKLRNDISCLPHNSRGSDVTDFR